MMDNWQFHLVDLFKISIPALLVFFTAQYLIRQTLEGYQQTLARQLKSEQTRLTMPLKLQAYERLALFCDRIFLPSLLLRVFERQLTVLQLKSTLLIQIQQEYEHNITQQVYVSEALWKIMLAARDEVVQRVEARGDDRDVVRPEPLLGRRAAQLVPVLGRLQNKTVAPVHVLQ
ncbi:MAG: hypothetical protein NWR67_08120, partial [Saprospiraceae bacterium]|nr:hypothetical protein [Saprospiraceae bacterium]